MDFKVLLLLSVHGRTYSQISLNPFEMDNQFEMKFVKLCSIDRMKEMVLLHSTYDKFN